MKPRDAQSRALYQFTSNKSETVWLATVTLPDGRTVSALGTSRAFASVNLAQRIRRLRAVEERRLGEVPRGSGRGLEVAFWACCVGFLAAGVVGLLLGTPIWGIG